MPDIGTWLIQHWDSAEHAVTEHMPHHEPNRGEHPYADTVASQAPADTPVTLATAPAPPEGEPMSLLDTIKNDIAEAEAKLKGLDEEALGKVSAVLANPETAEVLGDLNSLASVVGLPRGAISGVATGLKTLLSLYADPAQAAPAPAPAPVA